MKKTAALLIILLLAASLVACTEVAPEAANETETVVIEDMADRQVEVPKNPQRIVALGSSMLRQIAYLDAVDRVVGVEEAEKRDDWYVPYSFAYPQLAELPSIGPQHGGDAELIMAQNPQVIFHSGDPGDAQSLQEKTGIPVVVMEIADFPTRHQLLYECWRLLGKVLKKEDRSQELIDYTEGLIEELKRRTASVPNEDKPSVYVGGISHRGGHGIISTKVPFPPFQFLDANSVTDEIEYDEVTSITVSKEKLLQWDPEILFIDEANLDLVKSDLQKHPGYESIQAIAEGRVYGFLPYSFYHRNFATILANTFFAGKVLYPEQFEDVDLEGKVSEIYTEFLGSNVYHQMKEHYPGFEKLKLSD